MTPSSSAPSPLPVPSVELATPNEMGVAMSHLHYIVQDLQASKHFWTALGATVARERDTCILLTFPALLLLLEKGEPSGLSEGTVMDHVCFRVPDVAQKLLDMQALGYRSEPAPPLKAGWNSGGRRDTGFIWSPEGERIEIMRNTAQNTKFYLESGEEVPRSQLTGQAVLHHIHFFVPEESVFAVKRWYGKLFGAVPGKRWNYEAADLPGTNLNISAVPVKLAPMRGRTLDHVGFEVCDLQTFCRKMEVNGVKFDKPYTQEPSGCATAFLTDPWGTYIELTEGLSCIGAV